jgi:DNA invertase Pin-like site-specific DNA recombinase
VEFRLAKTYLDTGLRFVGGIVEFSENVMLLGYARVSTDQQDHALQLDALRAAGCDKVFVETGSGTRTDRPKLAKALEHVRQDDVLVVWRLDRLARSLRHLIDIADDLNRRGVALKSITENIDTTTPSGRFMFNILGALSSMEREIIVERTRAGLLAAAARGRRGGRPAALDESKIRAAKAMLASGSMSAIEVAQQLGCAPSTLYRYVPGGRSGIADNGVSAGH